MVETKSGRQADGESGHKGPAYARRFFRLFGIGSTTDDDPE